MVIFKKTKFWGIVLVIIIICSQTKGQTVNSNQKQKSHQIPYLKKQGKTTQLIVDDKPFIILGGELGNSSFTSLE